MKKELKCGNHSLWDRVQLVPWCIIELAPICLRNYWVPEGDLLVHRWGIPQLLWGIASRGYNRGDSRPRGCPREPCIAPIYEGFCIRNKLRRLTCLGYSSCPPHRWGMWVVHNWAGQPYSRYRIISTTRSNPSIRSARYRGSNCDASSWRWFCLLDRQHIRHERSQTPGFWFPPPPWVFGVSQALTIAKRARFPCFGVGEVGVTERECFWVESSDCW